MMVPGVKTPQETDSAPESPVPVSTLVPGKRPVQAAAWGVTVPTMSVASVISAS